MPYEFSIQEHHDHLRVEISGERIAGAEEEDAIGVWSEVAKACEARELHRVLCILKVLGRLPATAAYAIGFDPGRFGWSKDLQLALVNVEVESRQDVLYLEDVVVSSGYQMRVFDSEKKARKWLLGS